MKYISVGLTISFFCLTLAFCYPSLAQTPAEAANPPAAAEPAPTSPNDAGEAAASELGPAAKETDAAGLSPQEQAWLETCAKGSAQDVEKAIQEGADLNLRTPDGLTPLMRASGSNPDPKVIEALLKAGADPEAVENHYGLNALMFAASFNPEPAVVNVLAPKIPLNYQTFHGVTAIHQAATNNTNPKVLEALIKLGADIESVDGQGFRPLLNAAQTGNIPNLKALIELGANIDAANSDGETALFAAARFSTNPEVALTLIRAGANLEARNNRQETPIFGAASNSNPEVLTAFIGAGANTKAVDEIESSILFSASLSAPNVENIRRILVLGFDVNQTNTMLLTPIMAAALNPQPNIARYLLLQGADPNAQTDKGLTALMMAAASSHDPLIIKTLLGGGADPFLKDKEGRDVFDLVNNNRNPAVSETLTKLTGVEPRKPKPEPGQ
ncbi:MAG: ankyrin repeat domain-containing protein [Deltaproteobacteria bacterium]|jgi:ankyrin repeat protein|nr:ankyrin repeat domain-containing protein [Deltaproteobacteria bacterium]